MSDIGCLVKSRAKRKRRAGRRKPNARGKAAIPSLAALAAAELYELPFGKWKGYSLAQVFERDSGYVEWLAREVKAMAGEMARAYVAGRATL
ncbi:exodeoxyribonuclease X C-terminal domain-containing protein [Paludisphaera rhizosphaerae]|uniref:exodeoxyribonuclease X C-terminal domain-containing protein n=1 Tax=Paludisphaera rhizosphaerae TaxID=2711216 RepID=UPI0013EB5722|nr:hypothetical protein [Paludisphaera rhizosphaerae]